MKNSAAIQQANQNLINKLAMRLPFEYESRIVDLFLIVSL